MSTNSFRVSQSRNWRGRLSLVFARQISPQPIVKSACINNYLIGFQPLWDFADVSTPVYMKAGKKAKAILMSEAGAGLCHPPSSFIQRSATRSKRTRSPKPWRSSIESQVTLFASGELQWRFDGSSSSGILLEHMSATALIS